MPDRVAPSVPQPRLTSAEVEIVLRIVAGKTAPQIAAELNLSEDQVQRHLLAIFDKTACDTRTQLAAAWTLWGTDSGAPLSPAEMRAKIDLLTVERNALRQQVKDLRAALRYVAG